MRFHLLVPDISKATDLLSQHYSYFLINWWSTFSVSALASTMALFVALFLAIGAVRFRFLNIFLNPIVALSQSFPLQAVAPLIIILMGTGFHTKALVAFLIAFFPIFGTCVTAINSTPAPLMAYLKVCNATFWRGIYYCRLPAALPAIISSMKIGFTLAVLGAVVAEFINPDAGLGRLILIAQSDYDVTVIYICIAMLIVQGLTVYLSLSHIESQVLKTRRY